MVERNKVSLFKTRPNDFPTIPLVRVFILYGLISLSVPFVFAETAEEAALIQDVIRQKKAAVLSSQMSAAEADVDLDEFYGSILPKGRFLLEESLGYFDSEFHGNNGAKIEGSARFYSLENHFRFSPLTDLEIGLGFNRTFPARASLDNYNTQGAITQTQSVKLSYVDDYVLNARMRMDPVELYLDILEKRQKTKRDLEANYSSFSHFRVSYKEAALGARYLSPSDVIPDKTSLSMATALLLGRHQMSVDGALGYKEGRMTRDESFSAAYKGAEWYQTLGPQFIPGFNMRYGLSEDLELEWGLEYITPYHYKYQRNIRYLNGTTLRDQAKYTLKNNFSVPLGLQWRPREDVNIAFSSDVHYANQTIDYFTKNANDTTTSYPTKKLTYVNTEPTLTMTYLNDRGRQIPQDEFSSLTKTLILQDQFLIELEFKKDITYLKKGVSGGGQNILAPYDMFVYPAEYFVLGTEHAFSHAGNYSYSLGNVRPQNFYQLKGGLVYGLTDSLNAGLTLGYHSASASHTFMIPDRKNRFCKFKPYYFIDPSLDWRVSRNSLLSFGSHIVPDYKTFYKDTAVEVKSESTYYQANVAFKTLF